MSRTAVPEITYFFVFKRFFLAISLLGTLVMITLCVRDVDLYFQNPRQKKLEHFRGDVDQWKAEGLNLFSALHRASVVIDPGDMGEQVGARKSGAAAVVDPLKDGGESSDLLSYQASLFEWKNVRTPEVRWGDSRNATVTIKLHLDTQEGALLISNVQLSRTDLLPYANLKSCSYVYHGSWNADRKSCETYHRLKAVCVAMSWDSNNHRWQLQHGCRPGGAFTEYDQVQGESSAVGHGAPPNGHVPLSDLEMTLRSSQDPFISAMNLTDGSLNFGRSRDELWVTACMYFFMGCLLTIPCWVYLWPCMRKHVRRVRCSTSINPENRDGGYEYNIQDDDGL